MTTTNLAPLKSLRTVLYFVLVFCFSCNDKPTEIVKRYATGEISRRYYEVNGKKEGLMTEYYINGQVKGEFQFSNDLQIGRAVQYYPNGNIKEVHYYENGLKHGGDTILHENGKPEFTMQFIHGKKDGYLRTWSADGELIFEALYDKDSLIEVKGQRIVQE